MSNREQARTAVTKRLKGAVRKIAEHHPILGHYLSTTIKSGHRCAYPPGPEGSIVRTE
jgi:hypothetical protein